jgi:cephalosporin-C deacetylase
MKNKISLLFIQTVLLITLSQNALSQAPATTLVKVIVTPDHKDWNYKLNEEAKFSVQVLKYGNLIENVTVDYWTGPEIIPEVMKRGVVLKDGKLELSGKMKEPGFYRVTVSANVDGKKYEGMATAAFEPEKLQPVVKEPADFDSYWSNAIAQARKIDLQPTMTLVPERCTSAANVYHISFQNDKPGSKIYGMLAMPKKPGKYPALLKLPGGGVYKYGGDPRTASFGVIALEIGIHGIPVNLDPQVYADLSAGALANYFSIRLNDRDGFYFKRVIQGCVKAVDFIFTLPEFNGTDIAVQGQSQGGLLSLATAVLDKRVKFIAIMAPAFCDNGRFIKNSAATAGAASKIGASEMETLNYYDGAVFARKLTIPGFYSWGYNDIMVPPATMFATYNIVSAPKELHIYQDSGHWTIPEQLEILSIWLGKKLMGL